MQVTVLFVCLGNICRSPLAEGLFKKHVHDAGLGHRFHIDSCGTSNYHIGDQPDPRTRKNAASNGLQLNHQARQLDTSDFSSFHYILAMDESNLDNIKRLDGWENHENIHLMRAFDPQGYNKAVPDPYFGGDKGFQEVYEILDRSTFHFLEFLKKEIL